LRNSSLVHSRDSSPLLDYSGAGLEGSCRDKKIEDPAVDRLNSLL